MFPREQRIKKDTDFDRLFKKGAVQRGLVADLRWIAIGLDKSRFGFMVSTAISKKAVKRNAIRRQLTAVTKNLSPAIKGIYDILIVAKPAIAKCAVQEIEKHVQELFKKAKLIN